MTLRLSEADAAALLGNAETSKGTQALRAPRQQGQGVPQVKSPSKHRSTRRSQHSTSESKQPKKASSEHAEQCALFSWAATVEAQLPQLRLLFHPANEGKRSRIAGGMLKAAGLKRGVLDVWLPVAASGHHGMVIEMKAEGGRLRPEQEWWLDELEAQNWRCVVCWSWQDAARELCRYLGVAPERFGV